MIKKINPVARDMLRNRRSPQIIPNKKKNVKPDIKESFTDDPHDEMLPPLKPKKKGDK